MQHSLRCFAVAACLVAASSAEAGLYPTRTGFLPDQLQADLEGKLEFLYAQRTDFSSPRQDPQARLRLRLTSDLSSRIRFVTDLTGMAGGTARNPHAWGVYDFGHARQDLSPSLQLGEAYVDLHSSMVDLRLGLQQFAWGRLDAVQPNDLLNPERLYDPLLEQEEDRKIGVPAVAPTLYLPTFGSRFLPEELAVTLVWQPIYVPYLFPDVDERWYPPLVRAPRESEVMGFTVRNETRFRNTELPSLTLDNGTYAARVAGRFGPADFALYYFEGFDTAPALAAAARGFVRLDPANPQGIDVRSEIDVFPVFDRIRSAGGDLGWRVFDATVRLEAAYLFDRPYPRTLRDVLASEQIGAVDEVALFRSGEQVVPVTLAPINVRRNAIEWGVGADTYFGDTFVLVQANQTTLLRNDVDLLVSDYETRIALTVRRSFVDDRLKAELAGLYGMQGVYGMAHPRLTYVVNDHFDVRVGYLAIEGHEKSVLGQYRRNDEAYVRARLLF